MSIAKYKFRFDDISINIDMQKANVIKDYLLRNFDCKYIYYAVSVMVNDINKYTDINKEMVFPLIFNAYSDYRKFFNVDKIGIPDVPSDVKVCSHGLIHLDHRLLPRDAQEFSILVSCSLLNSDVFIPPFNKYNKDTEDICKDNNIELIKFEDGWLSIDHNKFAKEHRKWYLHSWRYKNLDDFIQAMSYDRN